MATTGKIPFASTFAVFGAGRAYEQIRNSVCYPNLNVKVAVTHSGLTVGEDGATHQMLEDIALMRVLPNMYVTVPADACETKAIVSWAVEHKGPVYIRMGRSKVGEIMPSNTVFVPGESTVLHEGKDITVIACGIMVEKAVQAAEILEKENISVRVINMSSIKPIDKDAILKAAVETGAILTCEEHSVIGGLGSAVSEVLSLEKPTIMDMIGINDTFGESGKANDLLEKYGLTSSNIVEKIKLLIQKK